MVILRAYEIVILPYLRTNPLFLSGSNDIVDETRIRYCYDFGMDLGLKGSAIWLRLRYG